MTERMDFADGKYTVINDNGKLTALRHGEHWGRDLSGDNLVYWMLVAAIGLEQQRDELLEALRLLEEAYCADDYGTREGRAKGRAALIATRAAITKATTGETK